MDGFDILGADIDMTSPQFQAAYAKIMADVAAQKAQPIVKSDPSIQHAWNAARYAVVGSAIGAAVGGVGLAALWASHRVLGFLLGFLVVGPSAGAGIGYAIGQSKEVK